MDTMKGQTKNISNEEVRRIPTQILESIFNKIIQEKFQNMKDEYKNCIRSI